MNWSGMTLGFCAVLAVLAAAWSAFAREARHALFGAAACALGTAGMCVALGSVFEGVLLALVLGVTVPAAGLAVVRVAPPAAPDVRLGRARRITAVALILVLFAGLAWLLSTTAWPPATGTRDASAAWLGWRLLTDDILVPLVWGALLGIAALVAASAIGPRVRRASGKGGA